MAGVVLEAGTDVPVPGAAVTLSGGSWTISDSLGRFEVKVSSPDRMLTITSLGYKTLRAGPAPDGIYRLQPDIQAIDEVVITATEDHGLTATTRIREDAISHIQPSSFADLLELLPGGRARDPGFSRPQLINLRSANALSNANYATSALGTRFLIDGRPVGNDANLQATPAWSALGSSFVNCGTDMRTLTTEDIESVDVVRGIASVAYGDLTSGLIKITRRKGGRDLRARFKADMKSKLFYVGKDFEWGTVDKFTMNASLNFLDSRADPRNLRQNYKRLTGSWRLGKTWTCGETFTKVLNASFDYTGSFDRQKSDRDLDEGDMGPVETYRSDYNSFSFSTDFILSAKSEESLFRSFRATTSWTGSHDLIDRWKHVVNGTQEPISVATEPGAHDAVILPAVYDATLQVDGRPFYAYVNLVASFRAGIHNIMTGCDWNMDKNFGDGTRFDPERPLSGGAAVRPRPYHAIPANHQLSFYAEENASRDFGSFSLEWMLGLRATAMAGAGKEYSLDRRPYLDPRANLRLEMPRLVLGDYRFEWGMFGGAGAHTKFPTMDMLYPEPLYGDLIQLNYWPVEENLRRVNLLVYRIDPTNPDVGAARNLKIELGADASWNGFSFSVDCFREDMKSGFRTGSEYLSVISTDYDESAIDKSSLTGPPALEGLPFVMDTTLVSYGKPVNGSRTLKQGVEFTFASKRIRALHTRITASGAWFLTKYMNSIPEYFRPHVIIDNEPYPYIGLYEKDDGYLYESFNTNLMFDTQIPRLGLIFSTSFQALWFTGHRSMPDDKYPVSYIDKKLESHPFTEADAADGVKGHMVREYTPSLYRYEREPFSMNINLKVMKKLYHDKVSCSLFVNRIFNVTPDYHRNGVLVRRNVTPYFGLELDFRL